MQNPSAHLDGASGQPHLLFDHLKGVAERAQAMAAEASPNDPLLPRLAASLGWLHDLGKYRDEFQDYLFGRRPGGQETRHAVFGAAAANHLGLPRGLSQAILGHHAGLHDHADMKGQLKDPAFNSLEVAKDLLGRLEKDWPKDLAPLPWIGLPPASMSRARQSDQVKFDAEFRARVLFSCLVDADYLDTEEYMTGRKRDTLKLDAQALFDRLDKYVRNLTSASAPSAVNQVRRNIYQACVDAAERTPGSYRLTAPTGSGKTLAAMAFALKHAAKHGLKRVIVVLPFLAIIEQNARVYRQVLNQAGEPDVVLEHHSGADVLNDDVADRPETENDSARHTRNKQATENWDAPIIVTTAVQFLESLFARQTSRCRKLHNIAQSVVIFDEVQTLPFTLLDPILSVTRSLRNQFGVTFLLGSATQPAFQRSYSLPSGFLPEECPDLLPDPHASFPILRRTNFEAPFLHTSPWTWDDLRERLQQESQALAIVNLRQHAQELYDNLNSAGLPGLFHLSSTMCPAHREAVLGKRDAPEPGTIYDALANQRPCIVVSTQVVEAGVDIDFPVVFRAVAPLDALIQAAGRCDREGVRTEIQGKPSGRFIVFEPSASCATPPGYYTEATLRARNWLAEAVASPEQVLENPQLFAQYHQQLIANGIGRETNKAIQSARLDFQYKTVSHLFKVTDNAGLSVVVPYGAAPEILEKIRQQRYITLEDRRKLQRYSVSLYPQWVSKLQHVLRPILPGEEGLLEYTGEYDHAVGIRLGELPPERFLV